MKEMLYEVRCLKSNEDMILALAGQFMQLSHESEKFRFMRQLLKLSSMCEDHIFSNINSKDFFMVYDDSRQTLITLFFFCLFLFVFVLFCFVLFFFCSSKLKFSSLYHRCHNRSYKRQSERLIWQGTGCLGYAQCH